MNETFDTARATQKKQDIINDVRVARDLLTNDIINYYWDTRIETEADLRAFKEAVRRYARRAAQELDAIIRDTE